MFRSSRDKTCLSPLCCSGTRTKTMAYHLAGPPTTCTSTWPTSSNNAFLYPTEPRQVLASLGASRGWRGPWTLERSLTIKEVQKFKLNIVYIFLYSVKEEKKGATHLTLDTMVLSPAHLGWNKVRSSNDVLSFVDANFRLCAVLWKILLWEK